MSARYLDALPMVPLGTCRGRPDAATSSAVVAGLTRLGQRLEQACAAQPALRGTVLTSLPDAAPGEVLAAWSSWIAGELPDTSGGDASPLAVDHLEVMHLEQAGGFRVTLRLRRSVQGRDAAFSATLSAESLAVTVVAAQRRIRRGLVIMLVGLALIFTGLLPLALLAMLIGGGLMVLGYARLGGPFTHQVWRHDPALAEALASALRSAIDEDPRDS
jgi:hypothetical protein